MRRHDVHSILGGAIAIALVACSGGADGGGGTGDDADSGMTGDAGSTGADAATTRDAASNDASQRAPDASPDAAPAPDAATDAMPDPPDVCQPQCSGKQCGADGCNGSCGTCPSGTACDPSGKCVCVPNCAGKACGDDGCGGSCGSCAGGNTQCVNGKCVCAPLCLGRQCGDDRCGGTCGTCGANETCDDQGRCAPACTTEEWDLANVIPNSAAVCPDGTTYTLPSVMYISAASSGQWYQVGYDQYLIDNIPLNGSDSGQFECCFIDPVGCVGAHQMCKYNGAWVACVCNGAQAWSERATSCTTEQVALCR